MTKKKKNNNRSFKTEACFQETNTQKKGRRHLVADEYQKPIAAQRTNRKNKKPNRAKTREEQEDEEYYTPISPDEMFLSLPRRIQCTNNGWKPYWDTMVQKDISQKLLRLPLVYFKLNEYNDLISLQRSLKVLALSKILISECNFLSEYAFEVNVLEMIQTRMKDIDTSRYQERLHRIEDNERRIAEEERLIEYRERLTEHRLNSDFWY